MRFLFVVLAAGCSPEVCWAQQWAFSTDPNDERQTIVASIAAISPIECPNAVTPTITLRCGYQGTLEISLQTECYFFDPNKYDPEAAGEIVTISRGGISKTMSFIVMSDSSLLPKFLPDDQALLDFVSGPDNVQFRFTPYLMDPKEAEFNLADIKRASLPVMDKCYPSKTYLDLMDQLEESKNGD